MKNLWQQHYVTCRRCGKEWLCLLAFWLLTNCYDVYRSWPLGTVYYHYNISDNAFLVSPCETVALFFVNNVHVFWDKISVNFLVGWVCLDLTCLQLFLMWGINSIKWKDCFIINCSLCIGNKFNKEMNHISFSSLIVVTGHQHCVKTAWKISDLWGKWKLWKEFWKVLPRTDSSTVSARLGYLFKQLMNPLPAKRRSQRTLYFTAEFEHFSPLQICDFWLIIIIRRRMPPTVRCGIIKFNRTSSSLGIRDIVFGRERV